MIWVAVVRVGVVREDSTLAMLEDSAVGEVGEPAQLPVDPTVECEGFRSCVKTWDSRDLWGFFLDGDEVDEFFRPGGLLGRCCRAPVQASRL